MTVLLTLPFSLTSKSNTKKIETDDNDEENTAASSSASTSSSLVVPMEGATETKSTKTKTALKGEAEEETKTTDKAKGSEEAATDNDGNWLMRVLQNLHTGQCITSCYGGTVEDSTPVFPFSLGNNLGKVCVGDHLELESQLRTIRRQIKSGGKERANGLKDLYVLTDRQHAYNRVPVICGTTSKKLEQMYLGGDDDTIIDLLASCILQRDEVKNRIPITPRDRRQACLVLGNLTIPVENKAVLLLGEKRDLLLKSLLHVIQLDLPESYLCCVCLLNLSYVDDNYAKDAMIRFVSKEAKAEAEAMIEAEAGAGAETEAEAEAEAKEKDQDGDSNVDNDNDSTASEQRQKESTETAAVEEPTTPSKSAENLEVAATSTPATFSPLDYPKGLLRTMEHMLNSHWSLLLLAKNKDTKVEKSVQGEAMHYSIGMIRNLLFSEENILLVGQTDIPLVLLSCIQHSEKDLNEWIPGSLEDLCLMCLVKLAQYSESVPLFCCNPDDSASTPKSSPQKLRDTMNKCNSSSKGNDEENDVKEKNDIQDKNHTSKKESPKTTKSIEEILRESFSNIVGKGGIHDMRAHAIICTVIKKQNDAEKFVKEKQKELDRKDLKEKLKSLI